MHKPCLAAPLAALCALVPNLARADTQAYETVASYFSLGSQTAVTFSGVDDQHKACSVQVQRDDDRIRFSTGLFVAKVDPTDGSAARAWIPSSGISAGDLTVNLSRPVPGQPMASNVSELTFTRGANGKIASFEQWVGYINDFSVHTFVQYTCHVD